MQELLPPMPHLIARVMVHQRAAQVRKLFLGIAEWITFRKLLQRVIGQRGFEMLQCDNAFKTQLRSSRAVERSDRHRVVEHVVEEANLSGRGGDFESSPEKTQIVTFPRTEHHAVLAQPYRFRVTISRSMSNGEEAHPLLLE